MHDVYTYGRIRLVALARTERGASAVEYALLATLIAVVVIAAVALVGGKVSAIFSRTSSSFAP